MQDQMRKKKHPQRNKAGLPNRLKLEHPKRPRIESKKRQRRNTRELLNIPMSLRFKINPRNDLRPKDLVRL
jgi:hypothetical protein